MASTKADAMDMGPMQGGGPMYSIGTLGGQLAASCPGGNHECMGGILASASPSPIHDEVLIEATSLINKILTEVAGRRKDKGLMMFNVGGEVLLCWAGHKLPEGFAQVQDLKEVRRLLGVKSSK
ncbi:MAG TPA: hypothetical protein VLZ81_00330 [Blastocatellia bacterium]|nr:hypothetical protein [Blastocatellia bacterium]